MKVLVAGALAGYYARDDLTTEMLTRNSKVTEVVVVGGNARTALLPKVRNVPSRDGGKWTLQAIVQLAKEEQPDFAAVLADEPLGEGLVDMLEAIGVQAFGPNRKAAQLEARKRWAIELMREAGIPHPASQIFKDQTEALRFAKLLKDPVAAKLDGFAGGKGVELCRSREEAVAAVLGFIRTNPGMPIIFQELLEGVEASVFCFTDGTDISDVVASCDYKRRFRRDRGPNTGSMGSFSWPEFWSDHLAELIKRTILRPIVDAMRRRGIVYKGVIYCGLMLTAAGPRVLEFNCRFGDAEGQVILPLLEGDLLNIMLACRAGRLHETPVVWNRELMAATVVMVDKNYPGSPGNNGGHVQGLDKVGADVEVLHYGTTLVRCGNSFYVALGGSGRRLSPMATGATLQDALRKVYAAIELISFPGADWRTDIGEGRNLPKEWTWAFA